MTEVRVEELRPGLELGPSRWFEIGQDRIDAFADVTEDHQWIHVDPEAAKAGPFGTTIAHGYLTLALLVPIAYELLPFEGVRMAVNYGVNRVRFPAPVPAGSRVRGWLRIDGVEKAEGGHRVTVAATVEREGGDKPVCAAEFVFRLFA